MLHNAHDNAKYMDFTEYSVDQAELMSGFIEFCVELKSMSEGGAAAETDGEASLEPAGQEGGYKNGRGGRRGMLHRQNSVVCSRVHALNTISYVDNGECNVLSTSDFCLTDL